MRSASSGSADRNAICVTFSLSRENAAELQNMSRSCADQLRELGVLAVQVGNTTAISLQPSAGNTCQSVHHGGTLHRRQQSLNTTRRNIGQYLGADIISFPAVVGSSNAAENYVQNNSVHHPNAVAIASTSPGITVDRNVNTAAESSPHIVNLLQHDVASSRSICLSSMPISSASDVPVRPRKRARRRTPSAAAEVSVPLSMFGTADCANSVYSFHQPSRCVDSSAGVSPVYNMPAEQFKVPESRRRKTCSSRKTAAAKTQQMPVIGQAQSNNLTNLFNAGFSDCSKSSEVGMSDATALYSMGDGLQMNGVNPYNRIPVMPAGWQIHPARSVPLKSLYHSVPAAAQYPNEYGHPQFRFAGNVDYSQVTANANRMPGVETYRNCMPGSSVVFLSGANQKYMKEERAPSVLPKQTLRWTSASESQSGSVPFGINSGIPMPSVHGLHNMTHEESGGLPLSHIMQRQFVASQSDALPMSDGSKPCTETVTLASEKMVHLSLSSDVHRTKNIPVCDAQSRSSLSAGHVNMPPPVSYQRVNGLFADVHSSALAFHEHTEHASHVKVNGDVDCLPRADGQALSKCETVFEKSFAVTVSPYAPTISSIPTSIGDTNCVLERQLQQPSTQLPSKVQQCGLTSFADTGVNGCSASTMPDVPKLSVSSGISICLALCIVHSHIIQLLNLHPSAVQLLKFMAIHSNGHWGRPLYFSIYPCGFYLSSFFVA